MKRILALLLALLMMPPALAETLPEDTLGLEYILRILADPAGYLAWRKAVERELQFRMEGFEDAEETEENARLTEMYLPRSDAAAERLPVSSWQCCTIFRDGLLYLDGGELRYIGADGERWHILDDVYSSASMNRGDAVQGNRIIVWSGTDLTLIGSDGRIVGRCTTDEPIQTASPGSRHALVVTGDILEPKISLLTPEEMQPVLSIDLYGWAVMEAGFFGTNDAYLWVLAADLLSLAGKETVSIYRRDGSLLGSAETGSITAEIIPHGDLLTVVGPQRVFTCTADGSEVPGSARDVTGWELLSHELPEDGPPALLLAPEGTQKAGEGLRELRYLCGDRDVRCTLPDTAAAAILCRGRIYAFADSCIYAGSSDGTDFTVLPLRLPADCRVTGCFGVTRSGYAVLFCQDEVYLVSLPAE